MNRVRLFAGIWLILFFLFLPFGQTTIPLPGVYLTWIFFPITKTIAGSGLETTALFSDSVHLYWQCMFLCILAFCLTLGASRSPKFEKTLQKSTAVLPYVLAFFLLKYGLEKWTHLQFTTPPPNLLYAPLGQMDKDILFWSTMGTSSLYAGFMGAIEVLAGIALLIPKYRFLGALISTGVFANVVAINFGFDISVKLLAISLAGISIYIIAPRFVDFWKFTQGKAIDSTPAPTASSSSNGMRWSKTLVVFLIFFECLYPVAQNLSRESRTADTLTGSYEIWGVTGQTDSWSTVELRRIHFHPAGHFITESATGTFTSYPMIHTVGNNQFKVPKLGLSFSIQKHGQAYSFVSKTDTNFAIRTKKLANESLPLLQDKFHWTVEGMIHE